MWWYKLSEQPLITFFLRLKWTVRQQKKLKKILKSLKFKNAHGYNEISVKTVKISSQFIKCPLKYVGNKYLSSGKISGRVVLRENVHVMNISSCLNLVEFFVILRSRCGDDNLNKCCHASLNSLYTGRLYIAKVLGK